MGEVHDGHCNNQDNILEEVPGATVGDWEWKDPVTRSVYRGTRMVEDLQTITKSKLSLPIHEWKQQLVEMVRSNNVVIVIGETGCGKSTQLPQYFVDGGLVSSRSMVAITQPRRIAAISLAQRVAEERGCTVGDEVGYTIRFEDVTSNDTVIKYMTDGLLCMQAMNDQLFTEYDIIIIDEAHERSIHSDVLLALVKKALKKRPQLRVVITSATLDTDKLRDYMEGAPVFKVKGNLFKVDVIYCKESGQRGLKAARNDSEYLQGVVQKVVEIHTKNSVDDGGILVFLPGVDEIHDVHGKIKHLNQTSIIHVSASLPVDLQVQVFAETPGVRKIILATNVAETSVTIPGIKYVVDSGYFRQNIYDPSSQMDKLEVTPVSQWQAIQRTGRAGRLGPGICFRMYSEKNFHDLPDRPVPAICRSDVVCICLLLKAIGVKNVMYFGFLDPPISTCVETALMTLRRLDALDNSYTITDTGMALASFPLSPVLGKMLLTSTELGCSDQVLSIVSLLSVKPVFRHPGKRDSHKLELAKSIFKDPTGDHLTLVNVFAAWWEKSCSAKWAADHCLEQRELMRALDIRTQLESIMAARNLPVLSVPYNHRFKILQAICAGLKTVDKVADLHLFQTNYKRRTTCESLFIHPSSVLHHSNQSSNQPALIVYNEVITTTKNYMRTVSAVKPEYLE